jgi:transposase-like protein
MAKSVGRKCSVCNHPDRNEIDKALVTRSASMRDIAGQYGVSRSALSRHKSNHLPRLVEAAKASEAAQAVTSGVALMDELDRLLNRALAILEAAEGSGQLKVALQAIREARECIKTCADLAVTAELEERVEELEELIEQREGLRRA